MEYQYTLINMFFYLGTNIYIYKIRHLIGNQILLITSLWFVCSIFSLLYLESPIRYYTQYKVELIPYVYLYVCFLLTLFPFLCIKKKSLVDNSSFVYKLTIFIALCAYIPFIENLIHLFRVGGGDALADMYGERLEEDFDARAHMSWIGARLNTILSFFTYISPILLFNYLARKIKKKLYVIVGLLMASFNLSIFSFAQGGRATSFNLFLYILFVYIYYSSYFSYKINRIVRLTFFVLGLFVIILMAIITIGRFSDSTYSLTDWILRYAGESFVNFNTELFYIDRYTDGRVCLPFLYDDSQLDRFVIESILGVRSIVFYTYIGDLYKDFGPYITMMILCVLSWIFYRKFKKNKIMNLGDTIIYCLYAALILLSTNCMFYRATSISGAIFALIFGIIYSKIKSCINIK